MRAFEGQMSATRPINRNVEEKKRQLAALRERLARMKSHESPTLRASLEGKIAALERELAADRPAGESKRTPRRAR